MAPQRHITVANEQLALLCSRCDELLTTATEQAARRCKLCQAAPDTATAPTLSRHPHTTAVRRSSTAPGQQSAPPRPRRRPDWIYEASRDELLALLVIYTAIFNHKPFDNSLLDDPHMLRDVQHLYVAVAEQYFDADTPYGITHAGILRWFEEQGYQAAQQD